VRGAVFDPALSGEGLQRKAASLGPRLSTARRVRSPPRSRKKRGGGRYAAALVMSFFRHQEIFPSDGDAGNKVGVPAHRLDEFPAGYPRPIALQQGPLPLYQPLPIVR
jgi:hypothetical protein